MSLTTYTELIADSRKFRAHLDQWIEDLPECFPAEIASGYHLHGKRSSKKLEEVQLQRIQLIEKDAAGQKIVLTVKPSAIMPYMTGFTDDVEKALYLAHKYNVPPSCLAYVFGQNESYWYRQMTHFGRYSIVQTTIQAPGSLPDDLLADEKHSRINGEKCYIATTIGEDCVLGTAVSTTADKAGLTAAYATFKEEAERLDETYVPKTVNTDGWSATQNAWKTLFPTIVIIECILHAFIAIRSCCKKKHKQLWFEIQNRFWDLYDTASRESFLDQINAFQTWATENLPEGTALKAVRKLKRKETAFLKWFDHPTARRTSTMLDRHMVPMDRMLDQKRYFHGHLSTAEKSIRAWAVTQNFLPYVPRAGLDREWSSPVHRLNKNVYHENWLHNLLVSTSNSPVWVASHQI